MMFLRFAGLCAAALLLVSSAQAASLIDFESVPGVTPMNGYTVGTVVPVSARLSNQLMASHGVLFSTINGPDYVALINLGENHATSGSVGIGAVRPNGGPGGEPTLNYGYAISMKFFTPGTLTPITYNHITILGDRISVPDGFISILGLDVNGNVVYPETSFIDNGAVGGTVIDLITTPEAQIHELQIVASNQRGVPYAPQGLGIPFGTVAFDDLYARANPEPSTMILLSGGLGAIVYLRYRRNKKS